MPKARFWAALIVALLCDISLAHGQWETERFIPLGQSPGVSGALSTIGTIVAVEPEQRRVGVAGPDGRVFLRIDDSTRIWIDRHHLGQSAITGSFADLREGRTVELKAADPDAREVAEWVKVKLPGPDPG